MLRDDLPHCSPARDAVEARKLDRFRGMLREVLPRNGFYAAKLARVADPHGIRSLADLADWPFTFKEELVEAAAVTGRPGNLTFGPERDRKSTRLNSSH